MACEHLEFEACVDVNRLSREEGGPITGYNAEIQIRCRECKTPFSFKGVPAGSSYSHPTVSAVYGEELRTPIEPAPGAPSWEDNKRLADKLRGAMHGAKGTA